VLLLLLLSLPLLLLLLLLLASAMQVVSCTVSQCRGEEEQADRIRLSVRCR
jgi:hypothetical protein